MNMHLGKKVVWSIKWMAAARLLAQLGTWVITIIVIRILSPEDYGLMAIAMSVIVLLNLLAEMGMGAALVQRLELDDRLIREAYTLALIVNSFLYFILYISAKPLSEFFSQPQLVEVVRVIGLQFFLMAISVVPQAMLEKNMQFKQRAIIEFVSTISGSLVTLYLALDGFGVWSLVYGNLFRMGMRTAGMNFVFPYLKLPVLNLKRVNHLARFGGWVTAERLLWYLYTESDIFIIGKVLGNEILGIYSVARQLASLPSQKLNSIITQVTLPAFSIMQDDLNRFRKAFLKATRIIAIFSIPIFFGISAISNEAIHVILGEKWGAAILPMQIMALVMPLKMLGANIPTAVKAIGKPEVNVINLAISCIVVPSSILIGAKWGLFGAVFAWSIAYPIAFSITLVRSMKVLGIGIQDFMQTIMPSILAGTAMYLIIMFMHERILDGMDARIRLLILVITGILSYPLASLVLNRKGMAELMAVAAPGLAERFSIKV